jgi:hypothetical protein
MYENIDKTSIISRRKHPTQDARTTNEKDDEKEKPLENSAKERFPITLQALNSHERDPRRLNNHQQLTNKHQSQQFRKKG